MEWKLLSRLSEAERREVLRVGVRRRYGKGETIFHAGDAGDALHLLAKGFVAVRVSTPLGDIVTLTVLAPGGAFGELALVSSDSRRSASIVALDEVETITIHRDDFAEACRRMPSIREGLVHLLADQIGRLSGQVLDALYVPADKRVIRRLADLAAIYAGAGLSPVAPARPPGSVTPAGPSASIILPATQEEIATMAGTTRPTVNRVLRDLAGDGIITLHRGRTEVLDHQRLAQRAR